jgi:cyclopropane-fatty-acyl-phospholipid synthase
LHEADQSLHFGKSDCASGIQASVQVHDQQLYRDMLSGGSIAAGEAYIRGYWSTPNLTEVMRFFSANLALLEGLKSKHSWLFKQTLRLQHFFNRNTQTGSRKNIAAHYDLGNDFFQHFLDPTMMYSAAVYENADSTLYDASTNKLRILCEQLELKPSDHLVEIGSGWGAMAVYAAQNYGCKVTTTTISQEQFKLTCERVKQAGLEDRVTVLCEDYRDLRGRFDKLVSIEMIEAVGHEFFATYFAKLSSLLKPHGSAVIQSITIPDARYDAYKSSVDFINRYIFPGGCLPSLGQIAKHIAEQTDLEMVHLRDITQDYARTLAVWRERFFEKLSAIKAMGFDDDFERLWEYYLCYCEGGFRERVIGTVQLTFAKPGYRPSV